ncbi:hypothetical protein [Algoriphagus sp.]|jgi:hypothetical protein|uniref:hypothetical protein n=1 Tax=Algoriphagus sp. TaxID=1872435 RepID=UPI002719C79A|nr:hypothetical protein [Algoriphagus sp.]MDO8965553.1 hypothetical protein [Algoriphagus sp.]MDP3201593.1 hypothetical protein [Algoriphagus sp.]
MDANLIAGSYWESPKNENSFFSTIFSVPKVKSKKIATPSLIAQKCNGIAIGTSHINYAAPCYPILATGGKTLAHVELSFQAGADAIVLSPPSSGELFNSIMNQYRLGFHQMNK